MWELKVIPRVKMFVWRACKNGLPTKGNLWRRGSDIDPICRLCGETVETLDHILVQCPMVQQIWYRSVLRIDRQITQEATFKDFMWSYLHKQTGDIASLVANTAWEIWKGRNSLCFENIEFSVNDVIGKSHARWVEYSESNERNTFVMQKERYVMVWKHPRPGEYKLNCDVAVLQNGVLGFGFVLRDEYGRVKLAGKKKEGFAKGSSTLMEGMAMRYAMQMVQQYGMTATSMESDSKTLIDSINGKVIPEIYLEILIHDIRQLARAVHCETFNFIPRTANQMAHYAARGIEFISINHFPAHLSEFAISDYVV